MTHLAIGRVAPEIAGEDLDGKPMKLGDYRGKVVVVSFWGAWCGACMAMVPNERDLAARLEGRPFAIVGVNSDEDRARARETKASQRMRWRSWWDGKVGGPIAGTWNVRLWPTFFIIDARGVIRAHGVLGEDMIAKTVNALLKEAEGASARAGDAWHLEFEEGRSAAKANGKDLLIDFGGSDWCLPCRWLKERVLSRPAFIERAAGTFVLVDIDLPVKRGSDRGRSQAAISRSCRSDTGSARSRRSCWHSPDGRPYARTTYREACKTPEILLEPPRAAPRAGPAAPGRPGARPARSKGASEPRRSQRDSARSIRGSSSVSTPTRGRTAEGRSERHDRVSRVSSTADGRSTNSRSGWICTRPRSTPPRWTR